MSNRVEPFDTQESHSSRMSRPIGFELEDRGQGATTQATAHGGIGESEITFYSLRIAATVLHYFESMRKWWLEMNLIYIPTFPHPLKCWLY